MLVKAETVNKILIKDKIEIMVNKKRNKLYQQNFS